MNLWNNTRICQQIWGFHDIEDLSCGLFVCDAVSRVYQRFAGTYCRRLWVKVITSFLKFVATYKATRHQTPEYYSHHWKLTIYEPNKKFPVKFQVITAATMKIALRDTAPCRLVEVNRRFRARTASIIRAIDAVRTSETSVYFTCPTRRYIH
jgi:hypothetical protein